MRTSSVAPAVTRAISIALAAAAVGVLVYTALAADRRTGGGTPAAAAPSSPAPGSTPPSPDATVPGSINLPSATPSATPHVRPADAKAWLKALAGTWTQQARHNYFRFQADGSGEWVAFGQRLWTGKATPRNATTFDLSDPNGQGASYWRVKLIAGGKRLFFAGTRKTYRKA